MDSLALSYFSLFAVATMIGFAIGWIVRANAVEPQIRDLEADIAHYKQTLASHGGVSPDL